MVPIVLKVYRLGASGLQVSFEAQVVSATSTPPSCILHVLDTTNDFGVRVVKTYGADTFQALFLAMRTSVRLLSGHFEYFRDDEFYLDPTDFDLGQGQPGRAMVEWLAEAYSWSTHPE